MHDVRDVKRLYFSGKSYYLLAMFNPQLRSLGPYNVLVFHYIVWGHA